MSMIIAFWIFWPPIMTIFIWAFLANHLTHSKLKRMIDDNYKRNMAYIRAGEYEKRKPTDLPDYNELFWRIFFFRESWK